MGKFIRFDINTVNSYGGRLRGGITDQYIEDKASQVADIARAQINSKTGKLASSIKVRRMPSRKGYPAFMVGTNVSYAYFVHEGSGQVRKWTYANNANNLYFFWVKKNVMFYGPKARYTYRKPRRFLTNALDVVF